MLTDRHDDPLGAVENALDEDPVLKTFRHGSHRSVAPAATIDRVKPLMRSLGITRIANVTGLDRIGIPVVMVCRPNSRSIAVCQGKGVDVDAATASGLMEAAEIHHAERIDLPLRLATRSDISAELPVIDVDRVPRVAGSIFHDDLAILWIEGFDLIGRRRLWLPFELVRANYTLPRPPGSGCFDSSTNGLASGNHLLEALCHGICETIERDANALWNQLPLSAQTETRIDPASVGEEFCRLVLDRLEAARFDVGVWETTSDIGVPSFYAVITDRTQRNAHIGVGSGSHPARGIALSRALTEAVQVRTTYISGARDDLMPDEYGAQTMAGRNAWAGRLMATGTAAASADAPDHDAASFNEDLAWLLDRVRAAGIGEVVAVNLTKPGFGLPIVKVVIPGLEGPSDHEAYVPGERALRARP